MRLTLADFILRAPDDEAGAAEIEAETEVAAPKDIAKSPKDALDKAFDAVKISDADFEEPEPDEDEYGDKPEEEDEEEKKPAKSKAQLAKEAKAKAEARAKAKAEREAKASKEELSEADEEDDADDEADDAEEVDEDDEEDADADEEGDDEDEDDEEADQFAKPPKRFSPDAQKEWGNTPLPVRAEVERAMSEMQQGIDKYRADAETFEQKGYRHLDQIFSKTGQNPVDVYNHYNGLEQLIQANPLQGFQQIAYNLGTTLEDIATKALRVNPDQRTAAYRKQIAQQHEYIGKIEGQLQSMIREAEETALKNAQSEIDAFSRDHPRLMDPEFSADVAFFISTGKADTLEAAYDMADRLNPDPRQRKRKPAAEDPRPPQTRTPGRSLEGAPGRGSDPRSHGKPSKSAKVAVDRAMRKVGM